eukprot:TRINITY_DN6676_c0_g1_i1.p1 TRINITY_DN6676_c0_g1~~TRINITY_DN6676_c0_g1_i1.p1  ORF type:complete len:592 (-),score=64.33 TRINITY_DN6676_c0_g1_i1:2-1555(-)
MWFGSSHSSSKRIRVLEIGWKKYLSEQILVPFLIAFLMLGSVIFDNQEFEEISEWSKELLACGVVCYLGMGLIICLNCKNSWQFLACFFLATLCGVAVLASFVFSRAGIVLMVVCIGVFVGFFVKNEIEMRYSAAKVFSSQFIFGLFVFVFFGATVAYCVEFWPDIFTHFNVFEHDHRIETIVWLEALFILVIGPLVGLTESYILVNVVIFPWICCSCAAIPFLLGIGTPFANFYFGLLVIVALLFVFFVGAESDDDNVKLYGIQFVFYFILALVLAYGGFMGNKELYYNAWINVLATGIIFLTLLLFVTLVFAECGGDDDDDEDPDVKCWPLLIGLIVCVIIVNTHDAIPAILSKDPTENDYWIRIVIFGILSIVPSPALLSFIDVNVSDLSLPMLVVYPLALLTFIGSGGLYVWFFKDLVFINSRDCYVWMARILPFVACSLFCGGLHRVHRTSTFYGWSSMGIILGFLAGMLIVVALAPALAVILVIIFYGSLFLCIMYSCGRCMSCMGCCDEE